MVLDVIDLPCCSPEFRRRHINFEDLIDFLQWNVEEFSAYEIIYPNILIYERTGRILECAQQLLGQSVRFCLNKSIAMHFN